MWPNNRGDGKKPGLQAFLTAKGILISNHERMQIP